MAAARDALEAFRRHMENFSSLEVKKLSEHFRPDIAHVLESDLRSALQDLAGAHLLTARQAQDYADWEKAHDAASAAEKLVGDVMSQGQVVTLDLWAYLFELQSRSSHPSLQAMLDEIIQNGHNLLKEQFLNKYGHPVEQELQVCQKKHRETLCALTEKLAEAAFPGHSKGHQSFPISSRYVELKVVSDCHFRKPVHQEHEVLEAAGEMHEYRLRKKTTVELERITADRLFRWCARSHRVPLLVMVSGVAGVGKTTLVQKFVFDWARGRHYQKFTFVFFFKFRELSEEKMSLESLVCETYPDLKDTLNRILQDPEKLLFIFDGLDESKSDLLLSRSGSQGLCTKPRDVKPVGVIVASLLKQTLLKGCSVLLTSRPSKLASLETGVFHRVASIVGFLSKERERYFTNFFGDDKTAREALAYVRDSQVLYTLCYNPSYCWITCTALQPCFAAVAGKPQPVPKTMTQLFVSYLTHIMTSHSQARPAWEDTRGILARLGWLADHGLANRLLVFDDNYLEAFGVQNSPFLTAFLVENPKSWEPCEVTYSFFHLTLQEFFSALVHYLDYQENNLKCVLDNARSCNEGNYEIFSRFLSGLSHPATRAPLERYLGKFSAEVTRHVIEWLSKIDYKKLQSGKEPEEKRKLINVFSLLFESRNSQLVFDVVGQDACVDFSELYLMPVDCVVLAYVLNCCNKIERLILDSCYIQDEGLEKLGAELHKIRELSLIQNDLKDTAMKDICAALMKPDCRLESLSLEENAFTELCCGDLAFALKENKTLLRLDLKRNKLRDEGLSHLLRALESPECTIQKLGLHSCSLSDGSCKQLSSALAKNSSLRHLNLSGNIFTDRCAADMKILIQTCPNLTEIRLGLNDFTPAVERQLKTLQREGLKMIF